ncbi:retrovirus-related pol polyprotein from transposon TNT 1-94 [Tanacetum coccineum]
MARERYKSHKLEENDNIVVEHGLSLEITQSQVGALIRVRGPKIVGASRIVEDQMKNTLKMEHPAKREAPRLHGYKGPPESLGLRISAGKKASQRLWMFKVKEEQNGRKRYKARLVVKGFQQKRGVDLSHPVSGGNTGCNDTVHHTRYKIIHFTIYKNETWVYINFTS